MAVTRERPTRSGRRLVLNRAGNAAPGRNSRREAKAPRRKLPIPWQGIRQCFATGGVITVLALFIGALSFGLVYTYRSLVSGEYFALKTLEVQGNSRLSSKQILEIAELTQGANTLALSIDAVEQALSLNPWVEKVSVTRVLPGGLIIRIREKTPAFWVLHQGALHYADAFGRIIAPVIPGKFASLPTLEVEPGAEEATAALPDLVKSLGDSQLPLNLASVSLVRLSAARGVEVYVEETRLKISIGLEEWLANLQRLCRTLDDLIRRGELRDIREIRAQGLQVWVEKRTPV